MGCTVRPGTGPQRQRGCLPVLPHPCATVASYEACFLILAQTSQACWESCLVNTFYLTMLNLASPVPQGLRSKVCSIFSHLPFCHLPLSSPDLVGSAPADVRWTCLVLDLHSILSLYLNRHYSHLKSIKLCSNLLVKNLCTSDLVFDPGEELKPQGGLQFLL